MQGGTASVPAIRCIGLSKDYGDVKALRGLDLEVPSGSVFGFLGRNGAGKTTTIRLLTGLAHPTAGSAWINGVETTGADSLARRQYGYLPQDPAFYGWMTPVQYLDHVAQLFQLEMSVRKQRIGELLELVSLTSAANRRISRFSGGMLQRLGIAQALIHRPEVLLLDEPTSSLDPAGRHRVLELIDQLRGHVTVFLSSHILGDVERVCDRIAIIHEGKLVLVADRQELMARYTTSVVILEIDPVSLTDVHGFMTVLRTQLWSGGVTRQDNTVRIAVTDIEAARRFVLPLVFEYGLQLNRYELARPSLEEIFLEISDLDLRTGMT